MRGLIPGNGTPGDAAMHFGDAPEHRTAGATGQALPEARNPYFLILRTTEDWLMPSRSAIS